LLNLLVDTKCYDGMISREVNFRYNDLSGAFNNKVFLKYFRQIFMSDGDNVLERIENEKPVPCFITHQIFSCKDSLFNAFGSRINIIEMTRHPLFLVDHWLSYQDRIGKHIRDLTVCKTHNNYIYPWYADSWKVEYHELNDFERVLSSISYLMIYVYEHTKNPKFNNQILVIPFEHFVLNPDIWLKLMHEKFDLNETNNTKKVMQDQMIPRRSLNYSPQRPIYARYGVNKENRLLRDAQDYERRKENLDSQIKIYRPQKKIIADFMACIDKYENLFGLWF